MGIIGAGGCWTGSNPSYGPYELNHHVRTAKVKFLISEPHLLITVRSTAKECDIPDSRVFAFDAVDHGPFDGLRSWEDLLQHGESHWVTFEDPKKARTTISALTFTSGTTGLPKAAMIPHHFTVAQVHNIRSPVTPYEVSRLICLPAFHNFAVPLISGCALREQHSVYMMRRFDLKQYLDAIEKFHITEIPMVPTMMVSILTSPLTRKDALESLRFILVGGSPLRYSTQADFQTLLSPEAKITQAWGMTETGWTTALFWPHSDDTGSVGRTLPSMSMKLVAEDGSLIDDDGVEGEIYVRGPCMMLGYLDNPEATAATIDSDGWLKSGDVAYRRQGLWYIIDRKKDILKVRGWQVAPSELEAILLTHPQIAAAAVIGAPIPDGTGEVPRAYVVRKPAMAASSGVDAEQPVQEDEVKAYLARRLAKYKALDGGVQFVDEIPKNASGKLMKFKLREMMKEGK